MPRVDACSFLRTCLVECLKPKIFAAKRRATAHKRYQTPIRPEDRYGSLPDFDASQQMVRFAPNNGHRERGTARPLSANSGHPPYRHNAAAPRFYEFGSQGFESLRARATSEFAIDANYRRSPTQPDRLRLTVIPSISGAHGCSERRSVIPGYPHMWWK
jgi:hypothetical protein